MSERSGTFTFLYTDIVASSRLWNENPRRAEAFVKHHNAIVRGATEQNGGEVFKSLGDGLACVFDSAHLAVEAAAIIQQKLGEDWEGAKCPTTVRVAVHSGQATRGSEDYNGVTLNRVSRIVDLASGGQILISGTAWILAADYAPTHLAAIDLGEFELAGNERAERIFQLCVPGLQQEFQSLNEQPRNHNLSALDDPFFGRQSERVAISAAIQDRGHRLTTILGFGGIGKTTLARRCAWDALGSFPDGVWWIDCESARTGDQLVQELCLKLEVPIDPLEPERNIWEAIGGQRSLLVIDCFEGVILHADVLDRILKHCPNVQLLVTSRIVLGLPWEKQFELGGMLKGKRHTASDEAIAVFVEAASAANPDFALTKTNKKTVSSIVESLEGVPLALILVAGRLRHMTLAETAEQLRLSLLSTARSIRKELGRHSGLRTVIESSLRLLPESERTMMLDLSVFSGGFTLHAASKLLDERDDLMGSLSLLRDHSLLIAQAQSEETRSKQLDSVQEYMAEQLPTNRRALLLTRHMHVFLQVAIYARQAFDSNRSAEVSRALAAEAANLRQAVSTAIDTSDSESLVGFGKALARIYFETGLLSDFARLSIAAAETAQKLGEHRLTTELLGLQGMAARRAGDHEGAKSLWDKRLHVFEELKDVDGQADTLSDLMDLVNDGRQLETAKVYLERLKRQTEASGKSELKMVLHMHEALYYMHSGDFGLASKLADECTQEHFASLNDYTLSSVSRGLAEVYRATKEYAKSYLLLVNALEVAAKGRHAARAARFLIEILRTSLSSEDTTFAIGCMNILSSMPRAASASTNKQFLEILAGLSGDFAAERLAALEKFDRTRPWDQLALSLVDEFRNRT